MMRTLNIKFRVRIIYSSYLNKKYTTNFIKYRAFNKTQ